MRVWTDAATDPLAIGIVINVDGTFWHASAMLPEEFCCQLLERDDGQIGVAECAAVLAAFSTFELQLTDSNVSVYIDNDGVLGAIIRGASTAPRSIC